MYAKNIILQKIRLFDQQITYFTNRRDDNLAEYFRLQNEEPRDIELIKLRFELYKYNINAIRFFIKEKQKAQKRLENLAC